ncbi:MAG: hypothetical protein ACTSRA_16675 [Promethearchaeota archaeon]
MLRLKVTGAQIPVLGDVEMNYESICIALDEAIEKKSDILPFSTRKPCPLGRG